MRPSEKYSVPADADCRIAQPCSSLRFAVPAGEGVNHLGGYILGGQRHAQRTGNPSAKDFTARWYTYRHPNCDWQDVLLQFGNNPSGEESPTITVQAGTGTAQVVSVPWSSANHIWYMVRAPWGAADSTYQAVNVKVADISLRGTFSWDVYRTTLSTGDHRVEHLDATYPAVGLMVDKAIASSATAGPPGIIQEIIDAWNNYHPQVMSWWTASSAPLEVNSGTLTNFFGTAQLTHRARAKTSTTSTTDTRWYVYSWCDAATTYEVTVSTGGDSGAVSGLTNTTPGWQAAITGVACTNNADDTITVSGHRTAGAGKVYLAAVSGLEE